MSLIKVAAVGSLLAGLTKAVSRLRERRRVAFTAERQDDEIAHLEVAIETLEDAEAVTPDTEPTQS